MSVLSGVLQAYLCSKDGEDELAWIECVENISDNVQVAGGWNIGLKADIAELGLWSDVDSDILTESIVLTFLEKPANSKIFKMKIFSYIKQHPIHRIPTRREEIIINLHVWNQLVNTRSLHKRELSDSVLQDL